MKGGMNRPDPPPPPPPVPRYNRDTRSSEDLEISVEPPTIEEVKAAIKAMKNKKKSSRSGRSDSRHAEGRGGRDTSVIDGHFHKHLGK